MTFWYVNRDGGDIHSLGGPSLAKIMANAKDSLGKHLYIVFMAELIVWEDV